MSIRSIVTLIILRDIHKNSVDIVLAYNKPGEKSETIMELPIVFWVKGGHLREWVIRMDKNIYGIKDEGMAWFEKLKEVL